MVLLVILDAIQNETNFRLFRIVKMVNQRSGDPPSLFVLEARGERTPDTSFFSPFALKKKRLIAGEKIVGKIDRGFFSFPPEGFEKTLVCVRNTLKLKSHIILIRLLILLLILVVKRCLLRLR